MADSALVSVATPRPGGVGVFYRAPLGSAIPTTVSSVLGPEYKDHGYIGDAGITNAASRDVQKKKAFGGATVATLQNDYTETYQVVLLEDKNAATLRTVFGDANVETDVDGYPVKVRHNKAILPKSVYIVDTIDGAGRLQRDVIEVGQVTTVGDIKKVHTDTVEYTITIECFENADGDNVVELREPAEAAAGAVPSIGGFTPSTVATAGGDIVLATGSGFLGTTAVTVGGTSVEFNVLSDSRIVFSTPAHASGAVAVVITNAEGPSTGTHNLTYA